MTLVNMCNNCPHNTMRNKVIGGAEVVPDWMQYIKENLYLIGDINNTQTFSQQEQHKREIEEFVSYKNRNLLKTISEVPAEYRPIFKNMFDELTKQIVEAKIKGENKC